MTFGKRVFDILLACLLLIFLSPVVILVSICIAFYDGFPIFYKSERMRGIDESFVLYKFRTMNTSLGDSGVSGGYKENRISPLGFFLRAKRLDELPQLLNVLKGDISFVGPRPPLRQYVEARTDLYEQVLKSRPGITGLASAFYHKREGELLSRCATAEETDAIYLNVCVPRKATYDLIYQSNASVCFDIKILLMTLSKVIK